jgi:two-component system NtrC family sensor kinase
MIVTPGTLLIVDDDYRFAVHLASEAEARGYQSRVAGSFEEALQLVDRDVYDAVVVDPAPSADTAFELLDRLRARSLDTELIVLSDGSPLGGDIQWFDPAAFTVVRKPDVGQLFGALARASERRRITAENRRFVWELQTINEIAADLTKSLELGDVLTGALQRLVSAMEAIGGSIRIRDEVTGAYETLALVGTPALRRLLTGEWPGVRPAGDRVIATHGLVIVDDFADLSGAAEAVPMRSAISVPLMVGTQLIGVLSLASMQPNRFARADQQLLTIIAGQIVIAVQNAQLHFSIRRAKREWEQTFDAISDPIAVFNSRGELLRGNRALAAHLDLPVTAIRRLSCHQVGFCSGGETCNDCAVTCALTRQEVRGEVTTPDGQIFSVTTFRFGVPSEGPSVVQVAKNVTDEIRNARRLQQVSNELAATNERLLSAVDQLKSAQAQLVQAEKLSAIGQLVAGVAHELNNPLTSVIGYAQLVEEELREGPSPRPPDEVAQDLRRIAEESERAARIVRNLLVFARRQSAARTALNIADVCAQVVALRAYEWKLAGIELQTILPADLPPVIGDGGQLQQVLLNLVVNAERAMRDRPARRLTIAAICDRSAGAVDLSVTDSGHGIDTATLSRIFDPFFTTREVGEGTGLGLSICYGIVRDHGGQIGAESRPQAGTTFHVTLPARSDDPSVPDTEILVAHPEQAEREFIGAALAGWGYRTVVAATLREAIEGYRRSTLNLAIVDRRLVTDDPGAWETARVDDGRRRVRVVLTSTTPDDPSSMRFGGDEAVAVLVPPIQLRTLYAAVRTSERECV